MTKRDKKTRGKMMRRFGFWGLEEADMICLPC
jgi:hypothetical protein